MIYRHRLWLTIALQPRGTGAVHTLYEVSRRPWTLAEYQRDDGAILNVDGTLSPVVHMWDRLPPRYWTNFTALAWGKEHARNVSARYERQAEHLRQNH